MTKDRVIDSYCGKASHSQLVSCCHLSFHIVMWFLICAFHIVVWFHIVAWFHIVSSFDVVVPSLIVVPFHRS